MKKRLNYISLALSSALSLSVQATSESISIDKNNVSHEIVDTRGPMYAEQPKIGTFSVTPAEDLSVKLNDEQRKELVAVQKLETIPVENHVVQFYTLNHLKGILIPKDDIISKLSFNLSDLSPITGTNLQGLLIDQPVSNEEPTILFSAMSVYLVSRGITLGLSENDYINAHHQVRMTKEMVNVDINGIPGIISYRESLEEGALIMLSWVGPKMMRMLSLAGKNVNRTHLAAAVKYAKSIKE